jgi:hypothetical protein
MKERLVERDAVLDRYIQEQIDRLEGHPPSRIKFVQTSEYDDVFRNIIKAEDND